ncbi:UNVERIFIED_CONTAM: hypothetical protein Sangu_0571000 [Sesamum angustifolium]|uniref:Uncharacterized protein n=1 Tax=Sesamum angustifolium TaxID=2727405 RepID=A0AAW2QA93_9LAMI
MWFARYATTRGHRRTNQIKSLPFLSCRSSERLAIFPTFGIRHNLERPQETVPREIFPCLTSYNNPQGDKRNSPICRTIKYGQEIDRRSQRRSTVQQDSNEARNLISVMASNTQQFGTRYDDPPRRSNERPTEHADAVGFSGQQQRRYDPFSNTYNPGWKDHPNLSYGAQSQNFQRPQYRPPMPPPSNPKQGTHLEDMMKSLISNTQQIQQNTQQQIQQLQQSVQQFQLSTQTSIQNLESQMSQLASSVSKLESQGKLPSQTVINPKQNASAIVLRSGKELQENRDENSTKRGHAQQRKPEKEVEIPREQDDETKEDNPKVLITKPPFPERFAKSKKDEEAKEILETFRKVEVNIPLLDAIKQIPRYARFLKELCTSKRYFTIPCKIGLIGIKRAMCDLGASINVMPLSIFESLHVGPLKETGVVIQLADRSVVYPEGVLEDVLVQVNELVFPADFYVLDMREDNSPSSTSILLGRPFLKTARTKIDVHAGTLSMEFDGEIIKFNIFDSMRYPSDIPTVLFVDAFDPFVQKFPAIDDKDYIKLALEESPMPMEEENMGVDPLVQVKKPQFPSSKKHRPMYHYHNPLDNASGKPATVATVRRSPPSSATQKDESEERNDINMADVAGTTPHQQTTLDDIARRIARMEANLIDLFEHVGLTPRRPPTP